MAATDAVSWLRRVWIVLGNGADEIDAKRLAGFEWCEVRSEFKRIATGWLDFGGRAGLPMFPAVPRFDECEHAMRLAVAKTRREYIYPAVHYASSIAASSTNYPAMGQRSRLKASVVIPSNWTTEEKAILLGLKKSLRSQHEQTWPREAVQNRQVLFRWGLAPRDSSSFRPRASPFDTARVRGEPCQTDRRRPCAKLKAQKHKFQTAKRVIASLKVRIRTGSILIICTLWDCFNLAIKPERAA